MSKKDKYLKQAAALSKSSVTGNKKPVSNIPKPEPVNYIPLKVGNHEFRVLDDIFGGAKRSDYPAYESIPEDFKKNHNKWNKRASQWFFSGGSLTELDIEYNTPVGVNSRDYWVSVKTATQMLLQSFDIPHEVKMATAAWCMSEWFKEI